jgi:hypothetical protein
MVVYTIPFVDVTVTLVWRFMCVHMTIIRVYLANTATHYKACGRQRHVKSSASHQNLCKVTLTFRLYLTTIHGYVDVRLCPVPFPIPIPLEMGTWYNLRISHNAAPTQKLHHFHNQPEQNWNGIACQDNSLPSFSIFQHNLGPQRTNRCDILSRVAATTRRMSITGNTRNSFEKLTYFCF